MVNKGDSLAKDAAPKNTAMRKPKSAKAKIHSKTQMNVEILCDTIILRSPHPRHFVANANLHEHQLLVSQVRWPSLRKTQKARWKKGEMPTAFCD